MLYSPESHVLSFTFVSPSGPSMLTVIPLSMSILAGTWTVVVIWPGPLIVAGGNEIGVFAPVEDVVYPVMLYVPGFGAHDSIMNVRLPFDPTV
jgi:hypothetical protein